MNITKTDKRSRVTSLLLVLALVCTLFLPVFQVNSTAAATSGYETKTGTNAYALFNSGLNYSSGSGGSNPNPGSYNNGGYDIYVSASNNTANSTARLGLSFTIMQEVTERATITINAYDVDESSGERDVIYLVDENTGAKTRIDYLRGMNSQWNTTTLFVDAACFIEGHTYHLELVGEVSGWVVYVRMVSILLTTSGSGGEAPIGPQITDHTFSATINSSGQVTTSLYLKTSEAINYKLELAASINNDQKGSLLSQSITATPDGAVFTHTFKLESGSPAGVYQIDVMLKNSSGSVLASYSTTAGYSYRAVSYHSNGGTSNVPLDNTAYSAGSNVYVRFDYIPSREGYTFLGWSQDPGATTPEYTEAGTNSFTMPDYDVSLYAIWKEGTGATDRTISIWNGSVATEFGGGMGTSSAPYLIKTASQLAYLMERIANGETFSGVYFKLTINIDLNRLKWTSGGTFSGIFDGGNHYVANLYMEGSEGTNLGLFARFNGATVKNLAVSDYTILIIDHKSYTTGPLVGWAENSVIKSCSTNGYYIMSAPSDTSPTIGGITGYATGVSIYDCYSDPLVTGAHDGTIRVGGLIGRIAGNANTNTTITRCYVTLNNGIPTDRFDHYSATAGIVAHVFMGNVYINSCVTYLKSPVTDAIAHGDTTSTSSRYTINPQKNYYLTKDTTNSTSYGSVVHTLSPDILSSLGWNLNSLWKFDSATGTPVIGGFAKPEPHVHDADWEYIAEPTCTLGGKRQGECAACGEYVIETLSPLGHDFETTSHTPATCTTDGITTLTCKTCGHVKNQINYATGHDFGTDGVCSVCSYTPDPHDHTLTKTVTAATCTTVGYTTYTCDCGYSYRTDYIDQLGHRWDEGKVTTEKTCTTNGITTFTCSACQETYERVEIASHDFVETVILENTCTTDGELKRVCNDCGYEETEVIPAAHKFDEGKMISSPTCSMPGYKECTCTVCGVTESFDVPKLGHNFYNGSCVICGATIPDVVTPDEYNTDYGMFFEIDDTVSGYGPDLVNKYGVLLDFNSDANIKKVAVYLVQEGNMWRRCIACVGDNITYATYVPYLSYGQDIKYTGLNSAWINTFSLSLNSSGVWCYDNYTTIGVNLADAEGNLLLSLYDIGQAGTKTRVFDDLDEMVKWLTEDSECINHYEGQWTVDVYPTCTEEGLQHSTCTVCGLKVRDVVIPANGHTESGWKIDYDPTCTEEGLRHKDCTVCSVRLTEEAIPEKGHLPTESWYTLYSPTVSASGKLAMNCHTCGEIVKTEPIDPLFAVTVGNAVATPGSQVEVIVSLKNNPGIMGAVISLNFDPSIKLVDVRVGGALSTLSFTPPANTPGTCTFVWDGTYTADTNSGILLTLTFEIPEDAVAGSSYELSVTASKDNMLDENLASVDVVTIDGAITVKEEISGDVNGDGVANVSDVLLFRRYLDGGYGITLDETSADINGDGAVNEDDLAALRALVVASKN